MRTRFSLLLLAAVGCGPKISTVALNAPPHPLTARSAADVEVFTTRLPERPYAEVAVFSASEGKANDHIGALRARAGNYGCDGLVFTVMPSQDDTEVSTGKPGELSVTSNATTVGSSSATCVVWTNEASPAASID